MGVKKMIKKLLLLLIVTELVVFYFIYTERQPKFVTDAPHKLVDSDLQKANPTQAVMGTSINNDKSTFQSSTLDEVKEKYQKLFEDLEKETDAELVNLISLATQEYQQNGMDISTLASMTEFMQDFKTLEEETDTKFNHIYEQLENELVMNNFSTSEAEEFKKTYENKKKELIKDIMQITTNE